MPIEDNNNSTTTTATVFVGEPAEQDIIDKLRAIASSGKLTCDYGTLLVPKKEPGYEITMPEVEARARTAPHKDVESRKRKKKSVHEGRKKMKKSVLALEKHIISLRKRFLSLEKHLISLEKHYKKFARHAKKPKTRDV